LGINGHDDGQGGKTRGSRVDTTAGNRPKRQSTNDTLGHVRIWAFKEEGRGKGKKIWGRD